MCKMRDPSLNINEEGFEKNSEEIQLQKFKRNQTGHEPYPRLLDVAEILEYERARFASS